MRVPASLLLLGLSGCSLISLDSLQSGTSSASTGSQSTVDGTSSATGSSMGGGPTSGSSVSATNSSSTGGAPPTPPCGGVAMLTDIAGDAQASIYRLNQTQDGGTVVYSEIGGAKKYTMAMKAGSTTMEFLASTSNYRFDFRGRRVATKILKTMATGASAGINISDVSGNTATIRFYPSKTTGKTSFSPGLNPPNVYNNFGSTDHESLEEIAIRDEVGPNGESIVFEGTDASGPHDIYSTGILPADFDASNVTVQLVFQGSQQGIAADDSVEMSLPDGRIVGGAFDGQTSEPACKLDHALTFADFSHTWPLGGGAASCAFTESSPGKIQMCTTEAYATCLMSTTRLYDLTAGAATLAVDTVPNLKLVLGARPDGQINGQVPAIGFDSASKVTAPGASSAAMSPPITLIAQGSAQGVQFAYEPNGAMTPIPVGTVQAGNYARASLMLAFNGPSGTAMTCGNFEPLSPLH